MIRLLYMATFLADEICATNIYATNWLPDYIIREKMSNLLNIIKKRN